MSGRPGKLRSHRVIVLYSDEEFEILRQLYARSINRAISAYVRKVSLEQPVIMVTRNRSFDAFIEEVIDLRKIMKTVYHEGQWSVDNQERLIQLHEEIKSIIEKIAKICMPN